MTVFAIDQATMTGWSAGDERSLDPCARGEPAKIDFGRFKMPPRPTIGERLSVFRRLFVERIEYFKPDLIAAEEPYWPPPLAEVAEQCGTCKRFVKVPKTGKEPFRTSADVQKFLQRLYGVAACTAADLGIPMETYPPQSWRVTALGHGFPIEPKKAMVLKARQLGCPVETEDEADAIGILLHALHGKPANARAQGDLLASIRKRL